MSDQEKIRLGSGAIGANKISSAKINVNQLDAVTEHLLRLTVNHYETVALQRRANSLLIRLGLIIAMIGLCHAVLLICLLLRMIG